MKKKLSKIISSLLIMAFLVSALSVFAFAADDDEESTENPITTIYNRNFDDGWEVTNGGTKAGVGVHAVGLGEEATATGTNHYLEMVTGGVGAAGYYQISPTGFPTTDTEFRLEFSVRSDGFITPGNVGLLYARVNGSDSSAVILTKKDDGIYFTFGGANQLISARYDEWINMTVAFKADYKNFTLTATLTADNGFVSNPSHIARMDGSLYPQFFRFQVTPNSTSNKSGDHVAFDNISYVSGTTEHVDLAPDDYGTCVNENLAKTVIIGGGSNKDEGKSTSEYIAESYLMKRGVNRALVKGQKVNIFEGVHAGEYGAPVTIDDVLYLPIVPLLDYMGFNYSVAGTSSIDIAIAARDPSTGAVTTGVTTIYIGRDEARVAGEQVKLTAAPGEIKTGLYTEDEDGNKVEISYTVIAMKDIEKLFPGWYITYDSMGFIMLAGAPNLITRETGLTQMADLLKKFVPDNPTAQELYDEFYAATNGFDHPYLFGKDSDFDFLRSIYNKAYLLEDGETPNQEFLDEHGLTYDECCELYRLVDSWTRAGMTEYLTYIVPKDHPTLMAVNGGIASGAYSIMFDENGNFIYPYTQDMKGSYDPNSPNYGKVVFSRNFTSKGTSGFEYDHIVDDYVVIDPTDGYYHIKRNYIYDETIQKYIEVAPGTGTHDYIWDDYVKLATPKLDYSWSVIEGKYIKVADGKGTHDIVGTDTNGDPICAVLRTPERTYRRLTLNGTSLACLHAGITSTEFVYNISFPALNYATYDIDPRSATYLEKISTVCYACGEDHFGYDPQGQRMGSETYAQAAYELAFAYQMTGELSFARLAYDILDIFGNWDNWGSAHALNYAEAAGAYAIAIDWIYDAVVELSEQGETNYKGEPMDIKILQRHLWDHGVGEDYVMGVMKGKTVYLRDNTDIDGWLRAVSSYYIDDTNNWGSVCNGNLSIACIGLLSYDEIYIGDGQFGIDYPNVPKNVSFRELTLQCLELKMWCLAYYAADSYLQNGAYTESPGYWAYGTNEMMLLQTVLYQTVGHDYGILDCPGYDMTFKYAAYMETELSKNKFMNYSYNDGSPGSMATGFFFTAALMLDQDDLSVIRYNHIAKGKSRTLADVFLFKEAMNSTRETELVLELEYTEPTIGLFTTRSDWEPGALFAGIMGGQGVYNHGHSDTGSWSYYNKGIMWIYDMGSESYNVRSDTDYPNDNVTADWDTTTKAMKLHNRFRYYRLSTEGHNTLFLTGHPDTLPYGHRLSRVDIANLIAVDKDGNYSYSDENGSYVMLNMTDIFVGGNGTRYANDAKRGMLLTNGRTTLVVQDEAEFTNMEYLAWCAHIPVKSNDKTGSAVTEIYVPGVDEGGNGQVAYLKTLNGMTCRVSIVMEYEDNRFTFEVRRTDPLLGETEGVYLLDSTFAFNSEVELGGGKQNSRDEWRNLVIVPSRNGVATTVRKVEMAVVMEVFDSFDEAKSAPVSYKYTPMENWKTYEEGFYDTEDQESTTELRKSATTADFNTVIIPNSSVVSTSLKFGQKIYQISGIYEMLTNSAWSIKQLGGANTFTGVNKTSAIALNEAIEKYDAYCAAMNAKLDAAAQIVENLT